MFQLCCIEVHLYTGRCFKCKRIMGVTGQGFLRPNGQNPIGVMVGGCHLYPLVIYHFGDTYIL